MKFRLDRDVLAEAVTWTARGLPQRPPAAVLAGVVVNASENGELTLSAFDYEVSATVTVPAEVDEPGSALVLGKLLADISRNLPAKPIDVHVDGSKVSMTCGASRFALLQMPLDEYPTLPQSPETTGTIPGDVFAQAVAQVAVAADRSDLVPILTAVRMEIQGSSMSLVATDRYRMAMRELTWNPSQPDIETTVLVPAKTLTDVAKSLGSAGAVSLALGTAAGGSGLIGLEAGQRHTTTRLIDGDYPKVGSYFPSSCDTRVMVSTAELSEAVKRVSLVADRNTSVRLLFDEGRVSISAGSGDDAQATEAIECQLEGPGVETAFNPSYLLDGLHAVHQPFTQFSFTGGNKPAMLSGASAADSAADTSYRYVIMPVRFPGA